MATRPKEYAAGLATVQAAARLTEAVRHDWNAGQGVGKLDKQDKSPVTVADFGVQALVCRLISESFPEDTIVAEEDSRPLREAPNLASLALVTRFVSLQMGTVSSDMVCGWIDRGNGTPQERFWVLDPIDGTKGFLRNDQYAIALALVEQGEVQWGFLACPLLPHMEGIGTILVARRGGGAEALTLDGAPLGSAHVSETAAPARARVIESVESAHTNHELSMQLLAALGIAQKPLRMDSQAKYAVLAQGEADIYLRLPSTLTYRENIWDHAAGWLLVQEAGGKVTDIYGQPLDWTQGRRLEANSGIVATNGHLHDAVIKALATLVRTES